MSLSGHLYQLLPALYRLRDAERGRALEQLCTVLDLPLAAVEADLARLYDAWFIETCDEELVPYIGDLLGIRPLHANAVGFSPRARVGHTIGYRRRKGTAAMLEQLARDVTGWPAKVVEYFQLLGTTQYLNHLRPQAPAWLDVRSVATAQLADSPFGSAAHTVDVRSIAARRGRYNLPSVGIHVWRCVARPIPLGRPREATDAPPALAGRCFTVDPLGIVAPLYLRPEDEPSVEHRATLWNVPTPIDRRRHHEEPARWYGADRSVEVVIDGAAVPLEAVAVCDLTTWDRPLPGMSPTDPTVALVAALDPVLGRLRVIAAPADVRASWHQGGVPGVGAGPEDRRQEWTALGLPEPDWRRVVTTDPAQAAVEGFTDLQAAVDAWLAAVGLGQSTVGLIVLADNDRYAAPTIALPAGSRLYIVAGVLPTDTTGTTRQGSVFTAGLVRPHVRGALTVTGEALDFVLEGVLLEGTLTVAARIDEVRVGYCTLADAIRPLGLTVTAAGTGVPEPTVALTLARCVLGPVVFEGTSGAIVVDGCVVDGGADPAISGGSALGSPLPAPPATITGTTTFGSVEVHRLTLGSDSIFLDGVQARSRQQGCVRFSYLAPGSRAPRRFRCQPDVDHLDAAEAAAEDARVRPRWLSRDWGTAGYARLSLQTPDEVRRGAEDEAEMGAWCFRKEPQREDNLAASLAEYLRFGLEAGILYADENQNGVRGAPAWPTGSMG